MRSQNPHRMTMWWKSGCRIRREGWGSESINPQPQHSRCTLREKKLNSKKLARNLTQVTHKASEETIKSFQWFEFGRGVWNWWYEDGWEGMAPPFPTLPPSVQPFRHNHERYLRSKSQLNPLPRSVASVDEDPKLKESTLKTRLIQFIKDVEVSLCEITGYASTALTRIEATTDRCQIRVVWTCWRNGSVNIVF